MKKLFALESVAVEIVNLNVIEPQPVVNIQPVLMPLTSKRLVLESISEESAKPCGHENGTTIGGNMAKTGTELLELQKDLKTTTTQKGKLLNYRINPEINDKILQSCWEK